MGTVHTLKTGKNREIPRKNFPGRKTKGSRGGGNSVPPAQAERIIEKYHAGKNKSEIAREEDRHWVTVDRIIKEEDVAQHVKDMREKWYGRMEQTLDLLFKSIAENLDGNLAYKLLKDYGVIPVVQEQNPAIVATPAKESEQDAVKRIATALVDGAIRRSQYFGLPTPTLEEAVDAHAEREKE